MSKKVTGKAFDAKVFGRLLGFAKKYRLQFIGTTFTVILVSLLSAFRPYLLIETVNDFTATKNQETLLNYILLMLVVLIAEVLLQATFIFMANWIGQHIIKDIRTKTFRHILQFRMRYFDSTSVGKLVTRVVSDIETIASSFSQGLFMIISDLLSMIVVTTVMLIINWKLALIALAVLPILVYATKLFQIAIKATFQEVRNQVANLNGFVQERVTGMKIVQLFNREKIEYDKFVEINDKHKNAHIKAVWYYSIFFPIAEILSSIAVGLLVWFGGLQAVGNANVEPGEIMGFIMMTQMLFRPLRQIADKFNTLQMGMVSGERVFNVIDTESSISKSGTKIAEKLDGTITFKDVHFSYIENEEVLKGISFTAKKGQTVAIVGATGAGKSTIINLINRFYEINSGTISVDGTQVEDYEITSLRNQIAIVLQDVFLFSDSILNNITLKDPTITREQVIEASKFVGLHDFIMKLPGDYDYNVKERGAALSTGQRQLISFVRAYVYNPKILILDEATSSLDSESELLVQEALDRLMKGRTSLVIAHRLSTIKNSDKILVMDSGEIVESGSHEELVSLENGVYRNLSEIQYR